MSERFAISILCLFHTAVLWILLRKVRYLKYDPFSLLLYLSQAHLIEYNTEIRGIFIEGTQNSLDRPLLWFPGTFLSPEVIIWESTDSLKFFEILCYFRNYLPGFYAVICIQFSWVLYAEFYQEMGSGNIYKKVSH